MNKCMFAGVSEDAEQEKEKLCSPSAARMRKGGNFHVSLKGQFTAKRPHFHTLTPLMEALVTFPNLDGSFHIGKWGQPSAHTHTIDYNVLKR